MSGKSNPPPRTSLNELDKILEGVFYNGAKQGMQFPRVAKPGAVSREAKQQILAWIESLVPKKKEWFDDDTWVSGSIWGYNQAIKDIKARLRG